MYAVQLNNATAMRYPQCMQDVVTLDAFIGFPPPSLSSIYIFCVESLLHADVTIIHFSLIDSDSIPCSIESCRRTPPVQLHTEHTNILIIYVTNKSETKKIACAVWLMSPGNGLRFALLTSDSEIIA